ncbi:MAG: nuclear transport factor 2 family protein, partial [Chloroflexota bacterium]
DRHKHYILNHLCELDGDQAHTETYWLFAARNTLGPATTLHGGRYLDRFERRAGKWAIAGRKCIIEWGGAANEVPLPVEALQAYAATGTAQRDTSDPAYQRPLTIDREAFVLPF